MQKAHGAQAAASKLRANAANYTANGYPDKAESENHLAIKKDQEVIDYTNKAGQLQDQMTSLAHEVQTLQHQINDLQTRLAHLTGGYQGPLL
jgi:hypothetical protein